MKKLETLLKSEIKRLRPLPISSMAALIAR